MVNLISPTSTILDLESVDVLDVVTSSSIEKTTTIDITTQQETTTDDDGIGNGFTVTRNLHGSTTENVLMFLSHPSSPVD